jgi:hypothetical protein
MNLAECIEALQSLEEFTLLKDIDTGNFEPTYDSMKKNAVELADRIHDLTRWIPVSERMPTEGERVLMMMQTGLFAVGYVLNGEWTIDVGTRFPAYYGYTVTHWQRITPAEATP